MHYLNNCIINGKPQFSYGKLSISEVYLQKTKIELLEIDRPTQQFLAMEKSLKSFLTVLIQ